MQELVSLLPLIGIALVFWLLIIRPASRRNKELSRMQSSLNLGDEVVLTSGVYGTVRELADDHAMVEIADAVVIKVARGAVGSVVPPAPATETDELDDPGSTDSTGNRPVAEDD